jgi:pilus assembly protein CpaF
MSSLQVVHDEGSDAYQILRKKVIERLEDKKIETSDAKEVRAVIDEVISKYQRRAHLGEAKALRDADVMAERIFTSITDFGALTELFKRSDIEEIFIEGAEIAYIDGSGRLQGLTTPTSEEENMQVVERLLATTDRHLDTKSPIVQARVLGGSARLTASISPISDVLSATLRKHSMRRETLQSLVKRGTLSPQAAGFLRAAMHGSSSVLIAGAPGTGKTTLTSACIASVPGHMCIRVCEEIRELNVPIIHGQYYEARPPSLDGSGDIGLRDLVKFTLAMRPDLIVVGEVRGAEAFELTRAVNAGTGFLCTVHANSAQDALEALVNAAIMAGENVSVDIVRKVFASSLDIVVFVDRENIATVDSETGIRRQVMEILAVQPSLNSDGFTVEPIFQRREFGAPLEWTGSIPHVADRIEKSLPAGVSVRNILSGQQVFL